MERRPIPAPGPGEVLVRIEACGVCGSDVFLLDGGFGSDRLPVVPGHEACGRVEELGDDVTGLVVGDQVALYYISNDPASTYVRSGRPNLGPGVRRMGVDLDGAFADYVVRPASTLIRPPAPVEPASLAVLTDAVAQEARAAELVVMPVSTWVNDVRHDDPGCLAAPEPPRLPAQTTLRF